MDKERHRQQVEILKQQNQITEERIANTERYGAQNKADGAGMAQSRR